MRPLQIYAALVTGLSIGAYLWGYHDVAIVLGWFVFPALILIDWFTRKRKAGR